MKRNKINKTNYPSFIEKELEKSREASQTQLNKEILLWRALDVERLSNSLKVYIEKYLPRALELQEWSAKERLKYNLPEEKLKTDREMVVSALESFLRKFSEYADVIEKIQKVFKFGIDFPEGIAPITFEEIFPDS